MASGKGRSDKWAVNSWLDLILGIPKITSVDTSKPLRIAEVVAIAENSAVLVLSETSASRVNASALFIQTAVSNGADIYGVTTGFGGSADHRINPADASALQQELIRFLRCGCDEESSASHVRAMILVRLYSLRLGFSGARWELLKIMELLLNRNVVPWVPLRGSITASGDLVPLAYLAAVITGTDGARARFRGSLLSASDALAQAGITPCKELLPKEGLALVNGTSLAAGLAAVLVVDIVGAFVLTLLATAMVFEGLRATPESLAPLVHELKPHDGQLEVAALLLGLVHGSKLTGEADHCYRELKQDRYSTRTAPQWLGPVLEQLKLVVRQISTEINSVTDNPIVDTVSEKVFHSGNFQGSAVTHAMDSSRACIVSMAKIIFAQFTELVNKDTSRGLPPNLCVGDPKLDYGMKGLEIAMASYLTEISYLSSPVLPHTVSAELGNQNINSCGLISARFTEQALKILQLMLASLLVACVACIDFRVFYAQVTFLVEECAVEAIIEASARVQNQTLSSPAPTKRTSAPIETKLELLRSSSPFTREILKSDLGSPSLPKRVPGIIAPAKSDKLESAVFGVESSLFKEIRSAIRSVSISSYLYDQSQSFKCLVDVIVSSIWNSSTLAGFPPLLVNYDSRGVFIGAFSESMTRLLKDRIPRLRMKGIQNFDVLEHIGKTSTLYVHLRQVLKVPAFQQTVPEVLVGNVLHDIRQRHIFEAVQKCVAGIQAESNFSS